MIMVAPKHKILQILQIRRKLPLLEPPIDTTLNFIVPSSSRKSWLTGHAAHKVGYFAFWNFRLQKAFENFFPGLEILYCKNWAITFFVWSRGIYQKQVSKKTYRKEEKKKKKLSEAASHERNQKKSRPFWADPFQISKNFPVPTFCYFSIVFGCFCRRQFSKT